MTTERFNEIVKEELDYVNTLMVKKQKEYNLGTDRLEVFKHGAGITGTTPEEVLFGFQLKHLISLADMIKATGEGKTFTKELWTEKLTDIINYNILLLGVLEDMNRFKEEK